MRGYFLVFKITDIRFEVKLLERNVFCTQSTGSCHNVTIITGNISINEIFVVGGRRGEIDGQEDRAWSRVTRRSLN